MIRIIVDNGMASEADLSVGRHNVCGNEKQAFHCGEVDRGIQQVWKSDAARFVTRWQAGPLDVIFM
jgi:hypothetical protein